MEEKKIVEVTSEPVTEEKEQSFTNEDVVTEVQKEVVYPELEEHKKAFVKAYNVSRWISYLSSAVVIAIIVVAYLVIFPLNPPAGTWAGVILIILTLIGSFVFSRFHRTKLTNRIKKYMTDYNLSVNEISLKDSKISNYAFDFNGEIAKKSFTDARLLKEIIDANSRNLSKYNVGRFDVELADFVAYRQDGKRARAAFLGKFLSATAQESIEGRVLLYLKPDPGIFKDAAGPDDIADLELLDDKPRYRLYATNKDVKKKFPLKALNAILEIIPDQELADVSVSMYENKVAITLTYSDALMVVPYKEEIPSEAIAKYKEHLTKVNNFLALL